MTDKKTNFEIRPFETLGAANHGWLDAHHHFSFGDYHDAARMDWGAIRVWNDDVIAPQSGFPPPSACRYGNHHLCPHRRDHAQGQSWQ